MTALSCARRSLSVISWVVRDAASAWPSHGNLRRRPMDMSLPMEGGGMPSPTLVFRPPFLGIPVTAVGRLGFADVALRVRALHGRNFHRTCKLQKNTKIRKRRCWGCGWPRASRGMLWGGHCRLSNGWRAVSCNVGYVGYITQGYGGMLWPLCRGTHAGYEGMPLSREGTPFIPYTPAERNPEIPWRQV